MRPPAGASPPEKSWHGGTIDGMKRLAATARSGRSPTMVRAVVEPQRWRLAMIQLASTYTSPAARRLSQNEVCNCHVQSSPRGSTRETRKPIAWEVT